jgi:glucosamine--fructose-6-phosphate aminotransferase (isomerizing)
VAGNARESRSGDRQAHAREEQDQKKETLMCGIVGIIGRQEVAPLLLEGLKRLEYRGYDSAGIATLVNGSIERRRAQGKLAALAALITKNPVQGRIGIGHTRWATHGVPSEANAHPIATKEVAVVHNGIIENFQELKSELTALGFKFESQTDTEVVAQLVTRYIRDGLAPADAVGKALKRLEGAFALVILFAGHPDLLICARRGSPLAIGFGEGEMYVGSDALALAPLTRRILYLDEGDWAVVTADGAAIRDANGKSVERAIKETALSGAATGKAGHAHYMRKEIFEQPAVMGDTLSEYFNPVTRSVTLPDLSFDLARIERVTIIACGTSYHAGLVAKYWIEQLARVPVEIDIASEFRYRAPDMAPGGLAIFISQSGETADTLAALRYAKSQGQHILAVVNQPESSIAREADAVLATHAGPEIGVASTKAFTTQLVVLACLSIALARARGKIDKAREAALSTALTEVPSRASDVLNNDSRIAAMADWFAEARDVLYLGRGTSYPLALEGALKLKEISYIHAEGYAAGEMKHGPIALIDSRVPIVVLAPRDELFEKTLSNVQEVLARGGKVVMISDREGLKRLDGQLTYAIEVPYCDPFVAPLLYAIPVQLLAYYVAVAKGTDVDQPRNLAKSVTVE